MSTTLPPSPIATGVSAAQAASDPKQAAAQEQEAPDDPEREHRAKAFTALLTGEVDALNGAPAVAGGETTVNGRQVLTVDGKRLPADPDPEVDGKDALTLLAGMPVPSDGVATVEPEVNLDGRSRPAGVHSGPAGNGAGSGARVATLSDSGAGEAAPSFDDSALLAGKAHKASATVGSAARGADVLAAAQAAGASPPPPATPADGAAALVHPAGGPGAAAPTTAPDQAAAASLAVPVPVNSSRWPEHVGQRVRWLINGQIHSAELRLEPPQLGLIQIHIEFHDHQAQVHFDARHADARAAIDAALPKLREMFADSGIALGTLNVAGDGAGGASGDGPSAGERDAPQASAIRETETLGSGVPVVLGEGLIDHYA